MENGSSCAVRPHLDGCAVGETVLPICVAVHKIASPSANYRAAASCASIKSFDISLLSSGTVIAEIAGGETVQVPNG